VFFWGGGWGGGDDETFPKFAKSLVLPKFWQNFMSSKFQNNHNTSADTIITPMNREKEFGAGIILL